MGLKALVLQQLGERQQALEYVASQLAHYPLSYVLLYAQSV